MDAKSIILTYKKQFLPRTQAELNWFRNQLTLEAAIENAAYAKDERGKRYFHQRRIRQVALEQAKVILQVNGQKISEATNFQELFNLVDTLLKSVRGIGELYVYDTALRIGAKLGHLPECVYLHAGTRKGATALRYKNRLSIQMSELPEIFQQLEPFQVEDILCIFKEKLGAVKSWGY